MFKTALVAIDINQPDGANRVAKAAMELLTAPDASFHLLNVVPDSGMAIVSNMLGPDHSRQMLSKAQEMIKSWAAETLPADRVTQLHVVEGTIYDCILKVSTEVAADVIVMGAHRPELKDYLLGPNAARVARHATQSVFVIR